MPCTTHTVERPEQADVFVTSVATDPSPTNPGESFTVEATVENQGGQSGAGTVTFTQDGSEIASEYVEVGPRESKVLSFSHSISSEGSYEICANYRSGF